MSWRWWALASVGAAVAGMLVGLSGCAARPLICTPIRLDDAPAFGCVDASKVDGHITPWDGVPAPSLPNRLESDPTLPPMQHNHIGPYWHYDGQDRNLKDTRGRI